MPATIDVTGDGVGPDGVDLDVGADVGVDTTEPFDSVGDSDGDAALSEDVAEIADDTTPSCTPPCDNGGVCIATDICDCTGTAHTGPTCATPCGLACAICEPDGALPALDIVDHRGDWLLATPPGFAAYPLSVPTAATALVNPNLPVRAFIASRPPEPDAGTSPTAHLARFTARTGVAPLRYRTFTTWDGFPAVHAHFALPTVATLDAATISILAQWLDIEPSSLDGAPFAPAAGAVEAHTAELAIVARSPNRVIIVGAVMAATPGATAATRAAIDALVSTGALAQSTETRIRHCDTFTVGGPPLLDVMFGVDDADGLGPIRAALTGGTDALFAEIGATWVDARWAVHAHDYADGGNGTAAANVCGMTREPPGASGSVWARFEDGAKGDFTCKLRDPGGARNCAAPAEGGGYGRDEGLACARLAIAFVQGAGTVAGVSAAKDRQRAGAALAHIGFNRNEAYEIRSGTLDAESAASEYGTFFSTVRTAPTHGPFVVFSLAPLDGTAPTHVRLFGTTPAAVPDATMGDIGAAGAVVAGVCDFLRGAAAAVSPVATAQPAIPASVRVVVARADGSEAAEVVASGEHGWRMDPASGRVTFFGDARPGATSVVTVAYQAFTRTCNNPDGCGTPAQ